MTVDPSRREPPPPLRVGITGHRLNKLPAGSREALGRALSRTLSILDDGVARAMPANAEARSGGSRPEIRIVSPLAEGIDRMAVEAAPSGWVLEAILPMPRADYERDFLPAGETGSASLDEFRALLGRAARVTELPAGGGPDRDRSRHYARLATALVGRVDLLVAVWDGRAAEGPGGTATVVVEALESGLGVAWIDPGRPDRTAILSGFDDGDLARPRLRDLDRESVGPLLEAALSRSRGRSA